MLYGIVVIISLFLILVGYSVGRRIGLREGFEKGLNYAPIMLRKEYYNTEKCPICTKK